jgi:hypothetical protein
MTALKARFSAAPGQAIICLRILQIMVKYGYITALGMSD